MKAKAFEFVKYNFDQTARRIEFVYKVHFEDSSSVEFKEALSFPTAFVKEIDTQFVNRLLEGLHIMLGISYYKLFVPPTIKHPYKFHVDEATFWNTVYQKGLGEFLFHNKLSRNSLATFTASTDTLIKPHELSNRAQKTLVGIGGGKDSIVAVELLKKAGIPLSTFFIQNQQETPSVIDNVVAATSVPHLRIVRTIDPQLLKPIEGAHYGHVPASAIFAFVGLVTAALYGFTDIVVGNEYSSNFGNIEYEGEIVNHQWSKSAEFEDLMVGYMREFLTRDIAYFSILRSFYEYRIVKMFANYKNYFPLFSSCNTNYTIKDSGTNNRWCGKCAKCVFMFTLLSAHVSKDDLQGIFGKNLYEDESLLPIFTDIVGLGSMKPFDCVGTFDEAKFALHKGQIEYKDTIIVKTLLPQITLPDTLEKDLLRTYPAPRIPTPFRFVGMESALILGMGREGKATKKYLQTNYPDLKLGEADKANGPDYLQSQLSYDIAIKTPGIPKEKVTIPYTTATNIFFSKMRNRVIGVTGTKGKSTTASLIYAILQQGGKKSMLLGNIGKPMIDALSEGVSDDALFVVELSSFQLDDIEHSPHIAVALNLFPDHMDYHKSLEDYYNAKRNIVRFQRSVDVFIYNPQFNLLAGWVKNTYAKAIPFIPTLPLKDEEIPLLGVHNHDNIRAAVAVAKHFNISDEVIVQAIRTFKPLPHRLERVGEHRSIVFYDDAISTTPESTIAALEALPQVDTIFLGGEDRGYDFRALEKEILAKGVRNIVLFPESGKRIYQNIPPELNILRSSSMREAVEFAYKHGKPGTICLLSTASPSYSLWKNFEEKGDEFVRYIKELA